MNATAAMLTNMHDEALATCRDWVRRNGHDDTMELLTIARKMTESDDSNAALIGYFAALGLLSSVLATEQR